MEESPRTGGMRTFMIVWFGQIVSIIGSGLTSFALGVWVFERTGSATSFALIFLFTELPGLIISPYAGVIVDQYDRRKLMLLSDALAGVSTVVVALLVWADALAIWHIYLIVSVVSIGNAFQVPAYMASIPVLVPREQLGRVNGLMQTAQASRQVIAPALAGFLFTTIQLEGIILVDVISFFVGVLTLLFVQFPRLPKRADEQKEAFFKKMSFGWQFIKERPGLLGTLVVIAIFSFVLAVVGVLITPMILAFTTPLVLGVLTSIGGIGMLIGSFVMSGWGGPARRIHGVLIPLALAGFFLILHGLGPSAVLIGFVAFPFFFMFPFVVGNTDVIWQQKVPLQVQGRVFATRRMLIRSVLPVGYLVAGPIADRIFEPLLTPDGPLANSIGQIIGVGEGRGIALMFILGGLIIVVSSISAYLYPRLRFVEDELPDAIPVQSKAAAV